MLAILPACERTELQKSINDSEKIKQRLVEDCEECPNMDDCCCALALVNPQNEITIQLCGTTDGDQATCDAGDPPGGCEEIDGLGQSSFTLNEGQPRVYFCMQEVHGLLIKATVVSGTVNLTFTCQVGLANPQTINIQFTSTGSKFFEVSDGCIVGECT